MDKLKSNYVRNDKLSASGVNHITSTINEIIDETNKLDELYNSNFLNDKTIFTVPTVAGNHIIIRNYKERKPFFEYFKDVNVSIMDYCYVLLYCDITTNSI